MTNITICQDTREKKGWEFKGRIINGVSTNIIHTKLDCGDYCIDGKSNIFTIERKRSVNELFSNLSPKSKDRFYRAIYKLIHEVKFPFMIIEDSMDNLFYGNVFSKMSPKFVLSSLLSFEKDGLHIIWAGSKGEYVALQLLKKFNE